MENVSLPPLGKAQAEAGRGSSATWGENRGLGTNSQWPPQHKAIMQGHHDSLEQAESSGPGF